MSATAVCLTLIQLAAATVVPGEPVATADVGPTGEQIKRVSPSGSLSVELYNAMVLAEQEIVSYGGNGDDDEIELGTEGASLLSPMMSGGKDGRHHLGAVQLRCSSCTGVLPERRGDALEDEDSYCYPDGAPIMQQDNDGKGTDGDREQNVCYGAMRCWKARVREQDGSTHISRGCVGSDGNDKHSAHHLLHPCMVANPVVVGLNETADKNNDNVQQPPFTVWTSSHTYSSAAASEEQSQTLPSYAIECCAGRDRCNDGPFPLLPSLTGGGLAENNDSLILSWWSSISMIALLFVVFITVIVTVVVVILFRNGGKKNSRRRRNGNGRRRGERRTNRHHEDSGGHSDDSDKNRNGHLSFSSRSSSSSSLSSVISSLSYCRVKYVRGGRKRRATALTMVDLLKGVTAANDAPADEERRDDPHQEDLTSGSGYGMPVLVQRTLAKQLQLRQLVGKGRYGEVWRATHWNGGHEHVAVKIFLSKDEPSWKRETEIYSIILLRHESILGFIGSDIMTAKDSNSTQLLLITHYHQYGSLYDFLQTPEAAEATCGYEVGASDVTGQQTDGDRPPLTMIQMLNVLHSVASGLCHLHTEIHGTQAKPGIAHRDIKSKNVLVKCPRTGACCLADFGMAITSQDATLPIQTTTAVGNNQNTRVGTKRYMSPEVLDDSIVALAPTSSASSSTSSTAYWFFDAYRRSDVYSYALVVWEVLSRTLVSTGKDADSCPPQKLQDEEKPEKNPAAPCNDYDPYVYRAPYQDRGVGWDPEFDDMRNIVCSNDPVMSRPGIANEWLANPILNSIVTMMRECWTANPHARLPALRLKKTLAGLIDLETEQRH